MSLARLQGNLIVEQFIFIICLRFALRNKTIMRKIKAGENFCYQNVFCFTIEGEMVFPRPAISHLNEYILKFSNLFLTFIHDLSCEGFLRSVRIYDLPSFRLCPHEKKVNKYIHNFSPSFRADQKLNWKTFSFINFQIMFIKRQLSLKYFDISKNRVVYLNP